jgi:hypothetical protein
VACLGRQRNRDLAVVAWRNVVSRSLTRRQVLGGVAGGIGLLLLSGVTPLLRGLAGRVVPAAELTHSAFSRLVGTRFAVDVTPGRTAKIQLLGVRSLVAKQGPAPTGEGFSLLFSGALTEKFGQGTYSVDNSSLGRFSMFLVPIGPPGPDQRYEAVFNRLWK